MPPASSRPIRILRTLDRAIFGRFHDHYGRMLERACAGCETLLDVGCGSNSPVRRFSRGLRHVVGVDAFAPAIERSRAEAIHHEYRLMDVLDLAREFPERSFDAVVASDLIEHLEKNDGLRLLAMMEAIARKKVIVFTPNGFLEQREYDGNRYQVHRSGWEVAEMEALGYRVHGISGWKPLRGELAAIAWRPRIFWGRVSLLTQPLTYRRPTLAFALLCVKDVKDR